MILIMKMGWLSMNLLLDRLNNAVFFLFSFYSLFAFILSCFGLCRLPYDINLQDDVIIAEPPPLEFYHMFGNKEAGMQVLENICVQLVEVYGNEVGALGRNIYQRRALFVDICVFCKVCQYTFNLASYA